jgi:GH25 family lysozyme M1 (1,4-beta-N-acetylmuramidase)
MSIKVIDISYWQQKIDYPTLAANVDGVILRACYGSWKDTWFDRHYDAFDNLGIPLGAYHYIVGSQTATAQAQAFAGAIAGRKLRLGIWNDVEDTRPTTALNRQLVLDYHARVEQMCGEMGVYTSRYKWDTIMRGAFLTDRKLWIANYGVNSPSLPVTGGWSNWWLWQYTDKGVLPGYESSLDLNHFNGTRHEFEAWIGDVQPEPQPVDAMWIIEMLGHLNIRQTPDGDKFSPEQYALRGETHHATERSADNWYKITRNGITGWISGNTQWTRITEVEIEPEPEPEPLTLEERVTRIEKHLGL